jgi:hypothetical protein
MVCLSAKRVDREPLQDWRVLQEIKNALVGEECEAIELFPAERPPWKAPSNGNARRTRCIGTG